MQLTGVFWSTRAGTSILERWCVARPPFLRDMASIAMRRLQMPMLAFEANQNVNESSSAIMITGGPPEEIFAALASVFFPPIDSAHC